MVDVTYMLYTHMCVLVENLTDHFKLRSCTDIDHHIHTIDVRFCFQTSRMFRDIFDQFENFFTASEFELIVSKQDAAWKKSTHAWDFVLVASAKRV